MAKVYYWNVKPNFGDLLTPLLLERFAGVSSQWSYPSDAELVVVGSVLDSLPLGWGGTIAGAGKLHEHSKLHFPNSNILALRGPLTAKGMKKGDYVLADPGLLADELVGQEEKVYNLGIIPHWTDKELEHKFDKYLPRIIRPDGDALEVIREISRCKKIVSSSLHGIILADTFSIPRRVEIAPRMLSHQNQEGGIFKFLDYHASISMKLEIGLTKLVDRNVILGKQYELFDVFEEIKRRFGKG